MAKCRCSESKSSNPRWRIKEKKPKGHDYQYKIICLSCEFEWWSTAGFNSKLGFLSQEEKNRLEKPFS